MGTRCFIRGDAVSRETQRGVYKKSWSLRGRRSVKESSETLKRRQEAFLACKQGRRDQAGNLNVRLVRKKRGKKRNVVHTGQGPQNVKTKKKGLRFHSYERKGMKGPSGGGNLGGGSGTGGLRRFREVLGENVLTKYGAGLRKAQFQGNFKKKSERRRNIRG